MRALAIIACLALAPGLAAFARGETPAAGSSAAAPPEKLFAEHMARLAVLQAVSLRFQQKAFNSFLDEEITRSGTLDAKPPNLLRWEYATEPAQLILMDGAFLWFHEPGKREVRRGPIGEGQYDTLIRSLFGDRSALERMFQVRAAGPDSKGVVRVTLVPRETVADLKSAELRFAPGDKLYRRIMFTDHYDQESRIEIMDVSLNPSLPSGRFTFVEPERMKLLPLSDLEEDTP